MEQKHGQISVIVNGCHVYFSFSDEPKVDLSKKIRSILLDSFISQNKVTAQSESADKSVQ